MNRFELKEQINTKQEKINSIKRKNPNNLFFKLKVAKNFIDERIKVQKHLKEESIYLAIILLLSFINIPFVLLNLAKVGIIIYSMVKSSDTILNLKNDYSNYKIHLKHEQEEFIKENESKIKQIKDEMDILEQELMESNCVRFYREPVEYHNVNSLDNTESKPKTYVKVR